MFGFFWFCTFDYSWFHDYIFCIGFILSCSSISCFQSGLFSASLCFCHYNVFVHSYNHIGFKLFESESASVFVIVVPALVGNTLKVWLASKVSGSV